MGSPLGFKISGKPLGKLGQFSQGLDPGPAQGLTQASPGQFFGQDFGQTEQQKQQHSRSARARPFVVSVPAVVSVVLFDQNLDQKFHPNLDQTIAS